MEPEKPSFESQGTLEKPEQNPAPAALPRPLQKEIRGFEAEGLKEPTRYGDWDVRGRCSDF